MGAINHKTTHFHTEGTIFFMRLAGLDLMHFSTTRWPSKHGGVFYLRLVDKIKLPAGENKQKGF